MTEDIRWVQRLDSYTRALHQLNLAVTLANERALSDLEKQGVIQGFEVTHELAWKLLKDFLDYQGILGIVGSRGAIREAFKAGLIADGELWMDMVNHRNLSSHTYSAELAQTLVTAIVTRYHAAFSALQRTLETRR